MQQSLSRKQEAFYDGAPTSAIDKTLRPGKVALFKGKRTSAPIYINNEETRWSFYGELDFGIEYADGGFGVADGKVSLKQDADELVKSYKTQLHAYAYMLEAPASGESLDVETLGLVQWRIDSTLPQDSTKWGFGVEHRYIPIDRNDEEFAEFMERFIGYIEGEFPDSAEGCYDCDWLKKIGFTNF